MQIMYCIQIAGIYFELVCNYNVWTYLQASDKLDRVVR